MIVLLRQGVCKHLFGAALFSMKCIFFCEDEKQRRENKDDRVPPERSIDDWLSRREKKKSALAAKGYAQRFAHMTPSRTRSAQRKSYTGRIGIEILHNLCPQRCENRRRGGGRGWGGGEGPGGERRASAAPLHSRPPALAASSPSRRMESECEHRLELRSFRLGGSRWICVELVLTGWT